MNLALLSFNRPAYLLPVLQSVFAQIEPFDQIYMFQDGSWSSGRQSWKASPTDLDLCARLFRAFFPDAQVFNSSENLGIAGNYRRAEHFMFQSLGVDHAVFLEDDLVLGGNYLDVIDQMLALALQDENIGYVAAYGDFWASLEEQRKVAGRLQLMHENWGSAMTRLSWLKQQLMREKYWQIVEGRDYQDRDHGAIASLYESMGYKDMHISSQDGSRWVACAEAGMVRLNTATCHARYIGETGVHSSPEHFKYCKFSDSEIYDEDVRILAPSSQDMAAWISEASRRIRFGYTHSYMEILKKEGEERMMLALSGDPGARLIVTCHDTFLAYDLREKICVSVSELSQHHIPVRIHVVKSRASLFLNMPEGDAVIGVDDRNHLSIGDPSLAIKATAFTIGVHSDKFSLSHDNIYVCCEPAGRVVCDREDFSLWESLGLKFEAGRF